MPKAKSLALNLSAGEKQRLALARALIKQPKWLFCDEPTSNLDDHNCLKIIDLIKQEALTCQSSLIIITHDQRVKDSFKKSHILNLAAA